MLSCSNSLPFAFLVTQGKMVFLMTLKRVLAVALLVCAAANVAKATVLPDAEVIWRPGVDVGNAIYDLAERLVNRARSHPDSKPLAPSFGPVLTSIPTFRLTDIRVCGFCPNVQSLPHLLETL